MIDIATRKHYIMKGDDKAPRIPNLVHFSLPRPSKIRYHLGGRLSKSDGLPEHCNIINEVSIILSFWSECNQP